MIANLAQDADAPAQTLTFSFVSNAVARAVLDAGGVFRWQTLEADGPGTYTFAIRIQDNGIPPLSATQSFQIVVAELNRAPEFNIREQWVKGGSVFTFATAFDADQPAQPLPETLCVVDEPRPARALLIDRLQRRRELLLNFGFK